MFDSHFVMLSAARTGSNALAGALHSHPNIYSDMEIFHSERVFGHQLDCETLKERDADPIAFLARHERRAAAIKPTAKIFGFKLFLDHNDVVKKHLLANNSWKKILLSRKNTLDQFISLSLANLSQKWVSHLEFEKPEKIHVSLEAYSQFHENTQRSFADQRVALLSHGANWIDLDYETVTHSDFEPLLAFLGADVCRAIKPATAKQNLASTESKVSNAADLHEFLFANGLDTMWVD